MPEECRVCGEPIDPEEGHSLCAEVAIRQRNEARALAREMLGWIEGMRPCWHEAHPWLTTVDNGD